MTPDEEAEAKGEVFRAERDPQNPWRTVNVTNYANAALSWEARGVLAYLLTRPDGWDVHFWDLVNKGNAGRDKMRGLLVELTVAGHLKRRRIRTSAGRFKYITSVYELPLAEDQRDPVLAGSAGPTRRRQRTKSANTIKAEDSPLTDKPSLVESPLTDKPSPDKPSTAYQAIYKEESREANEYRNVSTFPYGNAADAAPEDEEPSGSENRTPEEVKLDLILRLSIPKVLEAAGNMTVAEITALGKREKNRSKPRLSLLRDLRNILNERLGRVLIPNDYVIDLTTAIELVTIHQEDKRYTVKGSYGGILAALYRVHFTPEVVETYKPNPATLASNLPLVDGDARLLLKLLDACDPEPEGDPHRYLRGLIRSSAAIKRVERKDGNDRGSKITKGNSTDRPANESIQRNRPGSVSEAQPGAGYESGARADESLGGSVTGRAAPTGRPALSGKNPYKFGSDDYRQFERDKNRQDRAARAAFQDSARASA
jgi:hypothetical protein